ncbi:MAG TPA: tRNA uridine-5-carboxymethylaminomethyl(34) synthesis GTPase MnmE [Longimicrobiaceae bacterium]
MSGLFDDTIAAIATPAGRGAVALLRLCGPRAIPILQALCPALQGRTPPAREQRLLPVVHPDSGEHLDRALVTVFPAPASYTGDDTVELSTHGGVLTPQLVLDALLAAGARLAEPGEFTRRALFNGKLDLLQAEAILDLIDGRSPALHRAAVHQMERGLSRRIEDLRAAILRVEGLVAYSIDFPEEDEPPVPPARIVAAVDAVIDSVEALLRTAPEGELLREGALVVLAGRPNSGKSSLFNALLGLERAIVTEIPGTTRDALESVVTLGGYPFRVVDTAGLRSTVDRVEQIGIEVARRYLAAAELVIFCAEAGRDLDDEERAFLAGVGAERLLLVRTKADLVADGVLEQRAAVERAGGDGAKVGELVLCARNGAGMDALREALVARAFGGLRAEPAEAPLITRERHARALRGAAGEMAAFRSAMDAAVPMELAATHLRAAVGRLEELIGIVSIDDVLGEVFGAFCVGK